MARRFFSVLLMLFSLILSGCASAAAVNSTPTAPAANPPSSGVATTDGAPTCPDASGPIEGAIAFGGDSNLFAVNPDGSALLQITALPNTMWAQFPAWSPDGKTLAYTLSAQNAKSELSWLPMSMICGFDRATGKGRLLAQGADFRQSLAEPAWYADGQSLYVSLSQHQLDANNQYLGSTTQIARYDLQTSTITPLIEHGTSPALSQDGKRLSYIFTDPQQFDIKLMLADPDGQNVTEVTGPAGEFGTITAPSWSDDGQRLVFTASGGAAGASTPSSTLRTVFDVLLGVEVAEAHGVPADLWIVGADGQGLERVTPQGLDDPRAAWSPDGKQLAIAVNTGGVALRDIATGAEQEITDRGNFGGISWAPRSGSQ